MDLNGIKMFPGTQIDGVNILGQGEEGGRVSLTYSAAATPADLLAHYRREAAGAGYALRDGPAELIGTRRGGDGKDETVDITARPDPAGRGAIGTIVVSGK